MIVRTPVTRAGLRDYLLDDTLVKAVVDCGRGVMAVGGDLHADEESALLEDGASQVEIWGINLYPEDTTDAWIEFDSMINLRPSFGNRTRGVDDPAIRDAIRAVVNRLVQDV